MVLQSVVLVCQWDDFFSHAFSLGQSVLSIVSSGRYFPTSYIFEPFFLKETSRTAVARQRLPCVARGITGD